MGYIVMTNKNPAAGGDDMQVDLSDEERVELVEMIRNAHANINPEFHHTKEPAYREDLKKRQALLERLLHKLGGNIRSST
jgi:hypothetical protein